MLEQTLDMLRDRPLGFKFDELMVGTHRFVDGREPSGELPMEFSVTWGTENLAQYLDWRDRGRFFTNDLHGTVRIEGLVERAECRGTLELRYLSEAKIRYTFEFDDATGLRYRYVGEKVGIRPWNLHRTHTTCFGVLTQLATGKRISESILYFRMRSLPRFLLSFRPVLS